MAPYTSIRSQLLLLVLVVLLPLLGIVVYVAATEASAEAEQARGSALILAQLAAANVEETVSDAEYLLAQVAQRPLVQAMDPEQCDPFLRELPQLLPQFVGLGVVDASGQVICSTNAEPGEALPSLADRSWFQTVQRTRTFTVSEVQVGRLTGRWVSVLAYPILDEGELFTGALIMPIDLVRFQMGLDSVVLPSGTTITILDRDGTVVARSPNPQQWVGQNARGTQVVDTILAAPESEVQIRAQGLDGDDRLYGIKEIASADWHVYVGIPASVAFASVRGVLFRLGLLSLAIVVAVVILVSILMRQIERPIRSLVTVAEAVAAGKLDQRAPVVGPKELAEVARHFNHMLDVRELHTARLERQHENLQWLTQQLIETQEEERKRLAQELHDEAGQGLTALKFHLTLFQSDLAKGDNGDHTDYVQRIQSALDLTDKTMQQLRLLSHGLHPPVLSHFGLNSALETLCQEFASHTGLTITYEGTELPSLPETVGICFYRFLQEALANVAKHAEAAVVKVRLAVEGEMLALHVEDDGKGFDLGVQLASGRRDGIGLMGMQERFRRLTNGECHIDSALGRGTRLYACCQIPTDALAVSRSSRGLDGNPAADGTTAPISHS